MVTPPRLLRELLARLAPRDLRGSMLADLDELFQRRAAARGAVRARIWYTREALLAIPHLAALRAYRWSSRPPLEPRMTAFDTLVQDVRLAMRLFRRFPGSTAAAVATLALCIGANTAVFSLLEAVLLRPLPYADPGRLIVIWNATEPGEVTHLSLREVLGYRSGSPSVPHLAGYIEHSATFVDGDDPERVRAATVTTNAFETLGVRPLLGRAFHPADGEPGAPPTIVLSHALWTRQFGARSDIVGGVIRVSGTPRTVLGVMPEGFRLPLDFRAPRPTEAWLPMQVDPANLGGWGSRSIVGFGRLNDGVEPKQATSEFAVIADRWIRAGFVVDQGDGRMTRNAVPMNDLIAGDARRALLLLFAAVGAVLVIACATVTNLLLARAGARRQEIAVRAALGAGRRRIARQLLTESALMAGASGALGVAVAYVSVRLLKTLPATTVPRAEGAAIDATVLVFVIAATLATLLLFGLLPALQLSRPDLARTLNAGGRGARGGTARFRRGLVVTQLAVAVVLVIVAGLLARSLVEMYRIDLGFDPRRVLTAHTFLPVADYPTDGDVVRTFRDIEQRLASLPGATAAGAVRVLPLARTIGDWSIVIEGRPFVREENPNTDFQSATPGYFSAMGIALVRGRLYTHADDERAPLVTVINETMAGRYWPGEDPIGKRFHLSTADVPWLTIVGVVRTVRHNAVIEDPRAEAYIPHAQLAREIGSATRAMTVVLKTEADPLSMAGAMKTAVRGVGRYLPLAEVQTMEHVTAAAMSQPRFTAMLLGILAALALLLAALGVYSTVSLLVSERTREIGIRVALGASRRSVLRLVVGEGAALALGGLGVGIAGALAATRLLQGLLYGVEPLDAATFVAAPVVLATLAVVACLNPARRATRVDPVVALRHG